MLYYPLNVFPRSKSPLYVSIMPCGMFLFCGKVISQLYTLMQGLAYGFIKNLPRYKSESIFNKNLALAKLQLL